MCGQRAVPVDLSPPQLAIVRHDLRLWLAGAKDDLSIPERLQDPEQRRREAAAYERLLQGIGRGLITVPDREARAFLAEAAAGNDEGNEYEQVKAEHDALHALLAVLEEAE
jgi:phage-related minor tail protein